MPTFDSAEEIEEWLNSLIQRTVIPDVAEDTVKCLKEHAQKEVYDAFEPRKYQRRWSYVNDSGYDVNYHGNGVTVSDNVQANPGEDWGAEQKSMFTMFEALNYRSIVSGDLLPVIESGKGYAFEKEGPVPGPRPFFTHAKEEVEGGRAEQKVKDSLAKLGFKVS